MPHLDVLDLDLVTCLKASGSIMPMAMPRSLPELRELKERLAADSGDAFSAVFMTGSGSTIVGVGSHNTPPFLSDPQHADLFVRQSRLIARETDNWYQAPCEFAHTSEADTDI